MSTTKKTTKKRETTTVAKKVQNADFFITFHLDGASGRYRVFDSEGVQVASSFNDHLPLVINHLKKQLRRLVFDTGRGLLDCEAMEKKRD